MSTWRARAISSHSNLECFLNCTTPTVASQFLPKRCLREVKREWQQLEKERIDYFGLGDLWERYDEWSAYGAGAPIVLNNGESVVQYYVPYLSALQIYTSKSDCDESDSWSSDDSSDSDKLSRSLSNNSSNSSRTWDAGSEDSSCFEQEGLGLGLGLGSGSGSGSRSRSGSCSWPMTMRDHRLGCLYFHYSDTSSPYARIPLMNKINELSRSYPGLKSFKSVDLSPASWMAVAWYPIYHIPTGRNVKDLSACFLTYHTLSSSFQDDVSEDGDKDICSSEEAGEGECKREGGGISLPPFGLGTYKMQGDVWINPETRDHERLVSLLSAADSWLKQLRVYHHDFNYFTSHHL